MAAMLIKEYRLLLPLTLEEVRSSLEGREGSGVGGGGFVGTCCHRGAATTSNILSLPPLQPLLLLPRPPLTASAGSSCRRVCWGLPRRYAVAYV